MATRITTDRLLALETSLKAMFWDAYDKAAPTTVHTRLCEEVPSDTRSNVYPFVVDSGAVREFVGERTINILQAGSFELTNLEYELTYGIKRTDLEDDVTTVFTRKVRQGAGKFAKHPDKLLTSVIVNNPVCMDGVALFSASHPRNPALPDGNNYTNIYTGRPLNVENAAIVRAKVRALLGPDGEPLAPSPSVLLVPPSLEQAAEEVARAKYAPNAGGTAIRENVMVGKYEVIVMPQLEAVDATGWYMLDLSDADRPFIFQKRRALEFVTLFSPNDPEVFNRGEYVWGGSVRYVMGAGNPFKIAKCTA